MAGGQRSKDADVKRHAEELPDWLRDQHWQPEPSMALQSLFFLLACCLQHDNHDQHVRMDAYIIETFRHYSSTANASFFLNPMVHLTLSTYLRHVPLCSTHRPLAQLTPCLRA